MEAVTVSALTKYLQTKFSRDIHLQNVKLRGELSNVKFHNKGNCYFTLKDSYARISGIMFVSHIEQQGDISEILVDGREVEIEGSIRIYEVSGVYQIYATKIQPSGIGVLQQKFEQLFANYETKGYFSDAHKKEVPQRIERLGLITAHDGAAIEDMIKSIALHLPHVEVNLFSTLVQGEKAPLAIAKAIQKADKQALDALIVGRGGGSLEDLWAFNSEEVIEAIYAANTPIVSAVGHEVDTMLSDYVADYRAATPTAAIYYFNSTSFLKNEILSLEARMKNIIKNQFAEYQQVLQIQKQKLKELDPKHQILQRKQTLKFDIMRLHSANPLQRVHQNQNELILSSAHLNRLLMKKLDIYQNNLQLQHKRLALLNPKAQLNRGYAIVHENNTLISHKKDIQGDMLTVQFVDGEIKVKVVENHG